MLLFILHFYELYELIYVEHQTRESQLFCTITDLRLTDDCTGTGRTYVHLYLVLLLLNDVRSCPGALATASALLISILD